MGNRSGRGSGADVHTPLNISGEGAHPAVDVAEAGHAAMKVDTVDTKEDILKFQVGRYYADGYGDIFLCRSITGEMPGYPIKLECMYTIDELKSGNTIGRIHCYTEEGKFHSFSDEGDLDNIVEEVPYYMSVENQKLMLESFEEAIKMASGDTSAVDNEGTKYDTGKPMMNLLDPLALEMLAKVLTFGANKYEANNWRKGMQWSRIQASLLRHVLAFQGGEDLDPETGLPHLAHAMCNCMFLIRYMEDHRHLDDRPTE